MTDQHELDPATLRAIADQLSGEADAVAEVAEQMRETTAGRDLPHRQGGSIQLYASGYASGYLVSYLANKATQLRDLAIGIEMDRRTNL